MIIQRVAGVGEDVKECFIRSTQDPAEFEMGESGYVVEQGVFGGVCEGRDPKTTPGVDEDFSNFEGVNLELYEGGRNEQEYVSEEVVLVEIETSYLFQLSRKIKDRESLFYPDYLRGAPAVRADNTHYVRHRRQCRGLPVAPVEDSPATPNPRSSVRLHHRRKCDPTPRLAQYVRWRSRTGNRDEREFVIQQE